MQSITWPAANVLPPAVEQSALLDRNTRTCPDIHTPGIPQEHQADDQGHHRYSDRIPQTVVDITGRSDHRGRKQRQRGASS